MTPVPRIRFRAPPDTLVIFVVTERPKDYPQGYVLRAQLVRAGRIEMGPAWTRPTLEGLRAIIPLGLYRQPRVPHDDPAIVETWL